MRHAASEAIASRQNPLCKLVRALHSVKGRREQQLFLAEGENAVSAALAARWPLRSLLVSPEAYAARPAVVLAALGMGTSVTTVAPETLAYLADAETAPHFVAIAELPPRCQPGVGRQGVGCLLLLDGVGEPGNVGALVRAADAAGAIAVGLTSGSADPYSPKAVRASAGSVFNMPLVQGSTAEWAAHLKAANIPAMAAIASDADTCFDFAWPRNCALVVGNERHGISPELLAATDARVRVPMYGRAESLNVALAGAVLLYSWNQRHRCSLSVEEQL